MKTQLKSIFFQKLRKNSKKYQTAFKNYQVHIGKQKLTYRKNLYSFNILSVHLEIIYI